MTNEVMTKCKGCGEEIKATYLSAESLCYKCVKEHDVRQMNEEKKGTTKNIADSELVSDNTPCINCGVLLSKDANFCNKCGNKLEKTILKKDSHCTNCGRNNINTDKFCAGCGVSLQSNQNNNKTKLNKEIPAYVLFLVAVGSYGLSYLIGGIIGDSFGVFGLICLLLSVVRFFRERTNKK
jgi:predicted Zn-ribbon and HTH transcriptional regulator